MHPGNELAVPACLVADEPHTDSRIASRMQPQSHVVSVGARGCSGASAGEVGVSRHGRRDGPVSSALRSEGKRHVAYRTQSGSTMVRELRLRATRVGLDLRLVVGSMATRPATGRDDADHESARGRSANAGVSRGGVRKYIVQIMRRSHAKAILCRTKGSLHALLVSLHVSIYASFTWASIRL